MLAKKNLTWLKCKAQLNNKYLCDPLLADWWVNPTHRFNPDESSSRWTG